MLRRAILLGTLAAALAIAGCGRKSDLELPPDAMVEGQPPEGQPRTLPAGTAPAQVPQKSFLLDWLL